MRGGTGHPIIFGLLRTNRIWQALVLGAMSLGFVVNMAFVIVSRNRDGHDPDHARRVRAASPEMAEPACRSSADWS